MSGSAEVGEEVGGGTETEEGRPNLDGEAAAIDGFVSVLLPFGSSCFCTII